MMSGKQRTKIALSFGEPDRVPRFWPGFWPEFVEIWTRSHPGADPLEYFGSDVRLVAPDESAWPGQAGIQRVEGDMIVFRDGWGQLKRSQRTKQGMGELLEPAVRGRIDPDTLAFQDPAADNRYEEAARQMDRWKDDLFIFGKTGGPYLRAAFMRGEENFWMDVAEDPQWTRAFVDRVADHITAVGVEQIRRFGLEDSGIAIYDDVASSAGPFVGPHHYESIFLPALRRMVKAYKDAGAGVVMHHSDGNVLPLLDMWIDAGVQAINPVEFRTGMDPVAICRQYDGRLVCIGGLDNCAILPRGDRDEVRDHVLHLLEAGRGGGFVIGPHSIGPDVDPATM